MSRPWDRGQSPGSLGVDWGKGTDEFKVAADKMIEIVVAQLKTLKTSNSDR
jgi:hypothetical protein